MPKKLKVHPSERIDIPDFEYGTVEYPTSLSAQTRQKLVQGRVALSLDGFRIEVADQVSFPGQVTVHNGSYLSRAGLLVTNEDSVTSSESVTLTGANQTFYVELEAASTDTDIDDRAIWDATFDNGSNNLDGKEYIDSVTTRTSTIWRVVTPISTSAFQVTAAPNSERIPLSILKTDALGRITQAVNTGLVTSGFATVLEDDAAVTSSVIKVLNAALLSSSTQVYVGAELKTVSSVDPVNGLVFLSSGLAGSHARGVIVADNTGVSNRFFVRSRTVEAIDFTSGGTTHPDKLRRAFQGNEGRGKAIQSSPHVVGGRDDTQVQSLKDHVDLLAAQLKEMKIGGITTALPTDLSAVRYYDYAGSIQGAKEASFTIGNGTSSIGDFNGTSEAPFTQAIAAAQARGLTDVTIFVKSGTYAFTQAVTCPILVTIVGESAIGTSGVVLTGAITASLFVLSGPSAFVLSNVRVDRPTSSAVGAISVTSDSSTLYFTKVATGSLQSPLVSDTVSTISLVNIIADFCSFSSSGTVAALFSFVNGSTVVTGSCRESRFAIAGTSTKGFSAPFVAGIAFQKCVVVMSGNGAFLSGITSSGFAVYDTAVVFNGANTAPCFVENNVAGGIFCNSSVVYSSAANGASAFKLTGISTLEIRDSYIEVRCNGLATGVNMSGIQIVGPGGLVTVKNISISNVNINIINSPAGQSGSCITIASVAPQALSIRDCVLRGGDSGIVLANMQDSTDGMASVSVSGCSYFGDHYEPASPFQANQWGYKFLNLPKVIDLNILNNSAEALRGSTFVAGILVTGQTAATDTRRSKILIQGNTLKSLGRATADETVGAVGIQVDSLNIATTARISGNQLDTIYGVTVAGIYAQSGETVVITENTLANLVACSGSNGSVSGIVAPFTGKSYTIADNVLSSFADICPTCDVVGIYTESNNVSIKGNQVYEVNYFTAGSGYGIRAMNVNGLTCDGNKVRGSINGIEVSSSTVAMSGITVSDNVVDEGGTGPYQRYPMRGIRVFTTGSHLLNGVVVSGNVVQSLRSYSNGGDASGILVASGATGGQGVVISANAVSEWQLTEENVGRGISVSGISNAAISGNCITGADAGHVGAGNNILRAGIYLYNCANSNISSNICYWNCTSGGAANQAELYFDTVIRISCSGNSVRGRDPGQLNRAFTFVANGISFLVGNFIEASGGVYADQVTSVGSVVYSSATNVVF